jgi:hypothetical protein
VEAVQYGKPVLTFCSSWAAGLITKAAEIGLSIGFSVNKLTEAPSAIEHMAENLTRYQKDMETFRDHWLPDQNMRRVALTIARNAHLSPAAQD